MAKLARRVPLPSSPDRAVLVRHGGAANPETGGQYTVKRYREKKGPNGETQVVLEPANAAFAPIGITSPGVDDVSAADHRASLTAGFSPTGVGSRSVASLCQREGCHGWFSAHEMAAAKPSRSNGWSFC